LVEKHAKAVAEREAKSEKKSLKRTQKSMWASVRKKRAAKVPRGKNHNGPTVKRGGGELVVWEKSGWNYGIGNKTQEVYPRKTGKPETTTKGKRIKVIRKEGVGTGGLLVAKGGNCFNVQC